MYHPDSPKILAMKFQFNSMNIRKLGEVERYTIISHTLFSPWMIEANKVQYTKLNYHFINFLAKPIQS